MYKPRRPAIAMIELIFALVVMGIVLMSAPMLVSTASNTTSVALQQEGINEATSRINMILTYPWDQNDTNDSCIPPVLHVTSGDPELNENASTGRRTGVPLGSNSHTFKCGSVELNASNPLTVDGSDDIDDFVGDQNLTYAGGGTGVDYIEQATVRMTTAVQYIDDNTTYNTAATLNYNAPATLSTPNSSSNIKEIVVTLTSASGVNELNKTIVMRAFSCNLGGIEYEHRTLP